jgi:predicted kinase
MAKRLAANVRIVYCRAPTELLRERIQSRSRVKQDASEATLEVLDAQLEKFTPPCAPEPVIELATAEPISNEQLQLLVQQLVFRGQFT